MGKGAKIILLIIAILILGCGGLALYVLQLPDQPVSVEAELPEPTADSLPTASAELQSVELDAATPDPAIETDPTSDDVIPDGIYNVLFVGADSRTAEEAAAEGLSDSMMVVSYNTNTNVVTLISFMRDSMVWRIGNNQQFLGKLNAAYKNGGAQELMDTLDLNFELNLDSYVTVGYEGFAMLIDQLGGLDVDLTSEEAYYINWRYADIPQDFQVWLPQRAERLQKLGRPVLEEGYEGLKTQHLDGGQSLWYARNRTTPAADGTSGSDGVRINRQQHLMQLIYSKVKSDLTIDTGIALIKFAFQYVNTNMDIGTMYKIGRRVLKAEHIEFANVRVPFEGTTRSGDPKKEESVSGLYFDIDETAQRIHEIIYPAQ